MSTNVHLTSELEIFTRACVESGRYNNVSEVVRAALRLLQEKEERRTAFARMLDQTREEAERDGLFEVEGVLEEIDQIIAESAH